VIIRVSDTGAGISEEMRKRIFEPFFTTKEKGRGTGMGLAMVYGVIQNHDGFITVESSSGIGTRFSVYLPSTERLPEKINKERRDIPGGSGTILVVDDEETVRDFTRESLESLGYSVLLASDGYEALEIFNLRKEDIGLVILDLMMPKMAGDEAFHRMKLEDPDVNVLISSGFSIEEQTKEMMKDTGIAGFLHKPYNISEIADAVKKALSSV
jgi:CheY-like chemotaxis protein